MEQIKYLKSLFSTIFTWSTLEYFFPFQFLGAYNLTPRYYETTRRVTKKKHLVNSDKLAQPAFSCSKLTKEALEQGVKYVRS